MLYFVLRVSAILGVNANTFMVRYFSENLDRLQDFLKGFQHNFRMK